LKNVKVRGKKTNSAKKDEFRGKFHGSARQNPNSAARLEIPRKTVGPINYMIHISAHTG